MSIRDFRKEAIAAIKAELEQKPGQSRNDILLKTGLGIPDFQVAQIALNLVKTDSYGRKFWSLPPEDKEPTRINVMRAPDYVPERFEPPRAGSMDYKAIQSRGMPT